MAMTIEEILSHIDAEISRLTEARDLVAGTAVAEAIVVVLEAIDIDQQHRHALGVAHRLAPDALNMLIEHAAILNAVTAVPFLRAPSSAA